MSLFKVNDGTHFEMNYEVIENVVPEHTIFLHGNCASTRWWYPAEEVWKKEAKNKKYTGSLIYTDFRGCGKSSTPKDMAEVNMHTFAQDNIELLRSLNLGPVNIVGHSTGGIVAALMMAKEPSFFKKAVLLDPVGATGLKLERSAIDAFGLMKTDKSLVGMVLGATIYNNNPDSDFFRQIVVEDAFHCVNSIGYGIIKALDGLDVRKELAAVPNETLVLHGEFDLLLSVEASRQLAEILPRAEFQIVKGHGHCTNAEDPAYFVSIIRDFLFPSS